jgi:hypothetical protein
VRRSDTDTTPAFTSRTCLVRATRCGKSGWHITRSKSSSVGGNVHGEHVTLFPFTAIGGVAANLFSFFMLRFGIGV